VEVLPDAPAPLLVEGQPHERGVLPWDADIQVGRLLVRLVREREAQRSRPSLVLFIAPLVLGFALWSVFSEAEDTTLPAAPEPPELFEEAPSRCDTGRAPAHARAERDEAAARAKLERYPFDRRDGVEAVALFRHAHVCFSASGDSAGAARVEGRAERMEARVTADYDAAVFRLSRALTHEDWPTALDQAQALLELLAGRADPYVDWLTMLERRLRVRQAGD
jgi:hypothetical protein